MTIGTVWAFGIKALRVDAIYLLAKDGDITHVDVADGTIDIGRLPITSTYAMTSGRRVLTENLPTRMWREIGRSNAAGNEPLCDVETSHHGQIVTDRFRSVVEEVCGSQVHQLEPVEIENARRGEERRRWWFVPTVRLRALDAERTQPPLKRQGTYDMFRTTWDTRHLVFRGDIVADHHIFSTAEIQGLFFTSDTFRTACEAAGITGLDLRHSFPVA